MTEKRQGESEHVRQVRSFLEFVGRPVRDSPTIDVPSTELSLITGKLEEEFDEFIAAAQSRDLVKVADGIADIVYVALGAALQLGIDFDRVFDAIHEANLSKISPDGSVHLAEDGQILRGNRYVPPAVREALDLNQIGDHGRSNDDE